MSRDILHCCRSLCCFRSGLLAAMMIGSLSGCSGNDPSQKATTKVTGKVTYQGTLVTGGELLFSPISDATNKMPGKTGRAVIQPDGTYAVTTYSEGDGAVIGKHRLTYLPPAIESGPHGEPKGEQPFRSFVPSKETVDILKGINPLDIELVAAAPR